MDTSEKYVKMCEKAIEIQQGWKPQKADLYLACTLEARAWRYWGFDDMSWCMWKIWLPRQDQLQEMIDYPPLMAYMHDLETFCYHELYRKPQNYQNWSWEQLWLAFVMREKFNKTWDNEKEEWIKEKP